MREFATRFGLALALGLTTAAVGMAPTIAHAAPSVDVPDLPFVRYKLDNGMEVILHQDRRVPLVAVDVWYHVGSGDEVPGKSGFAHLFEHMMFQGAKHIGSDVHFDILRKIGSSTVNGTTNTDRTNYFEVIPSNHLETGLWLESDRMGYMLDLLNAESLQNQRDVVRNERRQRYDNVPFGKERFSVAAALYPEGHPYRYLTIGRHEDIESASVDDVRAFFRKWYAPSNATLVLAGDFDLEDAKAKVEKWFGSFPTLPKPPRSKVTTPALAKTVRSELEDEFARFPRLQLVWHGPKAFAKGDIELELLSDVLGARGWGRLHERLVVQEKLAASVGSYHHGQNYTGAFHIIVNLLPDADAAKAQAIVDEELAKLLEAGPRADELKRAVVRREASFVWGLESVMGRAEQLQAFNHYTGDPGFAKRYIEELRKATPSAVRDVAKTVLSKPRAEILTRPKAKK